MQSAPLQSELIEVDEFLADLKTLQGPPPIWHPSSYPDELQATWIVCDSVGIGIGNLRFSCGIDRNDPSITVTFRNKLVWRTDVVDRIVCKPNPIGAHALGLPATVCGSHHHAWPDNRTYVELQGFSRLPFRRELPPQVRRLPQALAELAREINLVMTDDQRGFDVPPAADLFDGAF